MTIRLDAAAVSDVGPHRANNQDAAFTASWGAAVADGVGGGPSGDLASAALLHRLAASVGGPSDGEALVERLRIANWELRAHVERDRALAGMATTFTGVFMTPAGALVLAHTGDSRAYVMRDDVLSRQTRDDSYVQALVDLGMVAEADAASHPQRNVITASLHGDDDDTVTVGELAPVVGDRWLLCSDGVTDYVPDAELAPLLARGTPAGAADAIVRLALEAGSHDNVTAVVCDVVESDGESAAPVFVGAAAERFSEGLESA